MTEYECVAEVDGQHYSLVTMGAVTVNQAYKQFDAFLLQEHAVVIEVASSVAFERIDVDI